MAGLPVTDCIFCRIAAGTLTAHVVHEDELAVAFLDIGVTPPFAQNCTLGETRHSNTPGPTTQMPIVPPMAANRRNEYAEHVKGTL